MYLEVRTETKILHKNALDKYTLIVVYLIFSTIKNKTNLH